MGYRPARCTPEEAPPWLAEQHYEAQRNARELLDAIEADAIEEADE